MIRRGAFEQVSEKKRIFEDSLNGFDEEGGKIPCFGVRLSEGPGVGEVGGVDGVGEEFDESDVGCGLTRAVEGVGLFDSGHLGSKNIDTRPKRSD